MTVELTKISPRSQFGMVQVSFSILAERGETYDGGELEVFVPASDSIEEIRRTAFESVRKLAGEVSSFNENEEKTTPEPPPPFEPFESW